MNSEFQKSDVFSRNTPYPPTPTPGVGGGVYGVVGVKGDFRETIPAYLNFAAAHSFFLYPKRLSYLSRNKYIRKIRARELGKASCLLNHPKNT